jgi:hypothetical protein
LSNIEFIRVMYNEIFRVATVIRLVAKLRRETIGEGFLRVIRVKIAVCSNATNKIFTCITCNKDPQSVRVVFRNKSIARSAERDAAIAIGQGNALCFSFSFHFPKKYIKTL